MIVVRAILVVVLMAIAAPGLCQEVSADKQADIEKLLDMTNALAIGQQMSAAMTTHFVAMLRDARPDIPQRVLDFIPEEVEAVIAANIDGLADRTIGIYDRHFTGDEIKALIAFYSTPVGRRAVQVMPALLAESMQAGNEWGRSLGPELDQRILARLKKEGY